MYVNLVCVTGLSRLFVLILTQHLHNIIAAKRKRSDSGRAPNSCFSAQLTST